MVHFKTLAAVAATAALTLGAVLPAHAQAQLAQVSFQKTEDAIKYRQSAFTVMAAHFGRVAGMAAGKIPFDAPSAAASAAIARTLSPLPIAGFVPGSDKGAPHRAKAEVWSDGAKFKAGADDMVAAMAKLDAAAKTGDLEQIKAAVGATGKTCKGCHDDYRAEKYSSN